MINPSYLRTFLSLCETKHFTHTAQQLHMTQPGVSQHLKKLEEELGVILFQRNGKKIEITPEGETLRDYSILQQNAEKSLRTDLAQDSPYKGTCKISCSGSLLMQLYPPLLELQKVNKGLKIHMEASPDQRTIDLIHQGKFGVGLITSNVNDPELTTKIIGYEKLSIAVPKGSKTDWQSLMKLGYINHPNGAHYASQVFNQNHTSDFMGFDLIPQSGFVNQLGQILLPVAAGLGFTALPESTIDQFEYRKNITKVRLASPCSETIFLTTKKYKPLPKRYDLVLDIIENTLSK